MVRKSRAATAEERSELMECDVSKYEAQLSEKVEKVRGYLGRVVCEEGEEMEAPEVYRSKESHFRQRCNFRTVVEDGEAKFVMFSKKSKSQPLEVGTEFARGDEATNAMMPLVLRACSEVGVLQKGLLECRFHTTLRGDVMCLLIYTKPIGDAWKEAAEELRPRLVAAVSERERDNKKNAGIVGGGIKGREKKHKAPAREVLLIGRSRKKVIITPEDREDAIVTETLLANGRELRYEQLEGEFSQPNGVVAEQMLAFALDATADSTGDLLELYCGNGHFSIALAPNFDKVLATEMSKPNVHVARRNAVLNDATNVKFARLTAADVAEALAPDARTFNRLNDLGIRPSDYDLKTVLVDPPRAGLEDASLNLCLAFPTVLYVSCNPETLARDLGRFKSTHRVARFAVFDQFPYSDHVEAAVLLVQKNHAVLPPIPVFKVETASTHQTTSNKRNRPTDDEAASSSSPSVLPSSRGGRGRGSSSAAAGGGGGAPIRQEKKRRLACALM